MSKNEQPITTENDEILSHLYPVQNSMSEIWAEREFLAVETVDRLGKAMNHIALAICQLSHDNNGGLEEELLHEERSQ
jgi:hypothetical protein